MHQYLFFIGDFPIRAYGVMLALAIISGASVAYFLLKKDGRGWHDHIVDFSITVAIAGLIGARLWDVFFLRLALLWQSSPRNSFRMARRHGHSRRRRTRYISRLLVSKKNIISISGPLPIFLRQPSF